MIKFYLGQKDIQHEIKCNTNSTITEIAGTFDLGTIELEWNECKYAIFPNTLFFIEETETNEIWSYIINQDNVEIVKKTNTVKYLHTLTLSQSIHKLNNVPLRNSVFSQPFSTKKHFEKNTLFIDVTNYEYDSSDHLYHFVSNDSNIYVNTNYNNDSTIKEDYKINLSDVGKITNAYLTITSKIITFKNSAYSSDVIPNGNIISGQNAQIENSYIQSLRIRIINYNNENDYIEFNVTDNIYQQINLSSNQINWLKNKNVYIKLVSGTIGNIQSICPQTKSDGNPLPALGFINVSLDLASFKYSLWDVLNILNKQCIKQYNGSQLLNYYEMPDKTTGQGLELDSIIAPEFNFTQTDLYEAVAKVLSFIDAFPILIENNILGYQYLNNLSADTINNLQVNDVKTTLNETNFTNKLASYYQNGKKNESIIYPAKNFYKHPTTSNYGVADKNDWYFYLNKPIDYIDKFIVRTTTDVINLPFIQHDFNNGVSDFTVYYYFQNVYLNSITSTPEKIFIDITNRIFPTDVYGNLPNGYASDLSTNKNNSLYYSKGDNKIYCGITGEILAVGQHDVLQYVLENSLGYNLGFGYRASISINYSNAKKDYIFNCEYHPILNGKVSQESISNKIEKETIVAQANSGTELNRLGNNLQGLIAKLGNEEKSITLPITKFKNKIKLGTHYIDELGNNWIVNKIQTTFTTDKEKVIVNATFTKNFNAMQQFTSLNQEKRFYEISNNLTSKGYENINEFIYFTNNENITNTDLMNLSSKIAFRKIGLQAIFNKTFNYFENDYALTNMNSIFDMAGIWTHQSNEIYKKTYIQPIVYGNGNQICFEMSFNNSVLADNYIDGNNVCNAWLYTEDDGFADYVVIIGSFTDKNIIYDTQWYPQITNNLPGTNIFELNDFYYYKKPNEIFHVNYSLNFLPYWEKTTENDLNIPQYIYEEIFFGDKFINENGIIPNTEYDKGKQKQFSLWVGNDRYSIIDQKAQGTKVNGTITVSISSTEQSYSATTGAATWGNIQIKVNNNLYDTGNNKSWCLADENGNIYIAVNKNENSYTTTTLSFFTSRNRKV